MAIICPKCKHERRENEDPSIPINQCPGCGIFYKKFLNQQKRLLEKNSLPERTEILGKKVVKNIIEKNTDIDEDKYDKKGISVEERMSAVITLSEHKTNHLLHLFLSIFTFGIWSVMWFLIAMSNTSQRNKIKKTCGMPTDSNVPAIILMAFFSIFIISMFSSQ